MSFDRAGEIARAAPPRALNAADSVSTVRHTEPHGVVAVAASAPRAPARRPLLLRGRRRARAPLQGVDCRGAAGAAAPRRAVRVRPARSVVHRPPRSPFSLSPSSLFARAPARSPPAPPPARSLTRDAQAARSCCTARRSTSRTTTHSTASCARSAGARCRRRGCWSCTWRSVTMPSSKVRCATRLELAACLFFLFREAADSRARPRSDGRAAEDVRVSGS